MHGKTMESLKNRTDVRLANNKKRDYLKWIGEPHYTSQEIFSNDLVAIYNICSNT